MKTFAEVDAWYRGARKEFGDPAIPVGMAFLRYVRDLNDCYRGDDMVCTMDGSELLAWVMPGAPIRLAISEDGPIMEHGQLLAFAADYVTSGLWSMRPSLNLPGRIHVFLTLYHVPNPAPWKGPLVKAQWR